MVTDGILPGGLKVRRRAKGIHEALIAERGLNMTAPHTINDWMSLYAMAVNEENAAGGQVVTAPTNGAAGVVPACAALDSATVFARSVTDGAEIARGERVLVGEQEVVHLPEGTLRAGGFANKARVKIKWVTSDDCKTPAGAKVEQCALVQSVQAEDKPNVSLVVIVLKTADGKSRLLRVVARGATHEHEPPAQRAAREIITALSERSAGTLGVVTSERDKSVSAEKNSSNLR